MKNVITILLIVISINYTNAQEFKYGKVSKEELNQKVHPLDSSANAAVLYREERISFNYTNYDGFMQDREVTERIKIYNKDGYEWATKKIPIYKGGSAKTEKLINLKGVTYNILKGKVTKDKLKKDGIFEEDYNEYSEITTLTMPNIQDGSIIEYSYKISSPFLAIDDLYFQSFIPINKLKMYVATPQFYSYDKQVNLKALYLPNFKEDKQTRVYSSTSSSRSGATVTKTEFKQSKSEYFDNTITISEENIPAIKSESFTGNIDNYMSKMSLELSAILDDYGRVEKSFSSSWGKVSKTVYGYKSFGGQFENTKFFKDDISPLMVDITNPFQKAAILCSYVKSKVKWNGNNGYTANSGIREAYKEGVGNVGDINLLLIAMLKSQGVNANPVLLSTKNNGIPIFPTRKGFNYVICSVEHEGSIILLDATEFYSVANILPIRDLNWQGRLIKDDGSSAWIPLRSSITSVESTSLNVKLNADLSANGKVRKNITSHSALMYRNRYGSMIEEDHIKKIEEDKGSIEISGLSIENLKTPMKPVKTSYDYELADAADEIGDKIYFTPLFFFAEKESPFKLEKRNYPIDFIIPQKDKYFINIMLPENYEVESIPSSEILKFKAGDVVYTYVAKQNGKYLQFSITFDLKSSLIDPLDYEIFKDFYEKIIEKQGEQVVLIKTQ